MQQRMTTGITKVLLMVGWAAVSAAIAPAIAGEDAAGAVAAVEPVAYDYAPRYVPPPFALAPYVLAPTPDGGYRVMPDVKPRWRPERYRYRGTREYGGPDERRAYERDRYPWNGDRRSAWQRRYQDYGYDGRWRAQTPYRERREGRPGRPDAGMEGRWVYLPARPY
jgi:hypothetical protein